MVAESGYVPERGDVIWISLSPQAGHEQAGRRPTLVVSPAGYNARVGLALLCPVTSHIKGYPFEVTLPDGLPVSGAILSDQLKSLDWRVRHAERACVLPAQIVTEVLQKLAVLLTPQV